MNTAKDTDTVQRFKVHYGDKVTGSQTILKIETSFRTRPPADMVETVNGIRTYKIATMINHKIAAGHTGGHQRDKQHFSGASIAVGKENL